MRSPIVSVSIEPTEVRHGQELTVHCRLYHAKTLAPWTAKNIYMVITGADGHVVWPTEVVRHDTSYFDIGIGTDDMISGMTYYVRVSNHKNLSPSGAVRFKIKRSVVPIIPPVWIDRKLEPQQKIIQEKKKRPLEIPKPIRELPPPPPGKLPTGPTPEFQRPEPRGPFVINPKDVPKSKIEKYIFRTQMDVRVCKECKSHENQVYLPDEERPHIPIHPKCRCTYDIIYLQRAQDAGLLELASVVRTAKAVRVVRLVA